MKQLANSSQSGMSRALEAAGSGQHHGQELPAAILLMLSCTFMCIKISLAWADLHATKQ